MSKSRKRRSSRLPDKLIMADSINLYREDFQISQDNESELNNLLLTKDSQESPVSYPNSRIKEISDIETEDISELLESQEGEVNRKLQSIKAKYTLPTAIIEEEAIESGGSSTFINSHRNYDFPDFEGLNNPKNFFDSYETKKFDSGIMSKRPKTLKKGSIEVKVDKENHPDSKMKQKINHVKNSFKKVLKERTNFENELILEKDGYFDGQPFCKTFDYTTNNKVNSAKGNSTLRRLNLRKNTPIFEASKTIDDDKENYRISEFSFKKTKEIPRSGILGSKFNRSFKHLRKNSYTSERVKRRNNSYSQKKKKADISNELIKKSNKIIKERNIQKTKTTNFLMKLKQKLSKTSEEYIKNKKLNAMKSEKALKFSKYLEMNKKKNMMMKQRRNSACVKESSLKEEKIKVMEETIKNQNMFIKSLINKIDTMKNLEDILVENEKLKMENRVLKIDLLKMKSNNFLKKCSNCR